MNRRSYNGWGLGTIEMGWETAISGEDYPFIVGEYCNVVNNRVVDTQVKVLMPEAWGTTEAVAFIEFTQGRAYHGWYLARKEPITIDGFCVGVVVCPDYEERIG